MKVDNPTQRCAICVAWEAEEITEGQAMRALGLDRQAARELKQKYIRHGQALATLPDAPE